MVSLFHHVSEFMDADAWLILNTGDVVHIKIFGQPVVILNSLQASRDLLDKRSSIYSDRPRFVLLSEL